MQQPVCLLQTIGPHTRFMEADRLTNGPIVGTILMAWQTQQNLWKQCAASRPKRKGHALSSQASPANHCLALCAEFPSLSWLAKTPEAALRGIQKMAADMQSNGKSIPQALAEKHHSGEFRTRIPPQLHRSLALMAAEEGVSLNGLASAKLAA